MIIIIEKVNFKWTESIQNDNIMYFVQRVLEMLDYSTCDIYRMPLLNTCSLLKEYRSCIGLPNNKRHLNAISEELVKSIKEDIVLYNMFGDKKINQIISKVNSNSEKRNETYEYLLHSIYLNYGQLCRELLLENIFNKDDKKELEKLIRIFLPQLLFEGYSRESIYLYAKYIFYDSGRKTLKTKLKMFINHYDKELKKYSVYLGISKELYEYKDTFEKHIRYVSIDTKAPKNIFAEEGYYLICFKDVEAIDESKAVKFAYQAINKFVNFYHIMVEKEIKSFQEMAYVFEEGTNHIQCIATQKKKFSNSTNIVDNPEEIIAKEILLAQNNARCSMSDIYKLLDYHGMAISNIGLENAFLNLWSILETISSGERDEKLNAVLSVVVPILEHDYFGVLFNDLYDNLIVALGKEKMNKILEPISEVEGGCVKLVYLLLVDDTSDVYNELMKSLKCYPVIRYRLEIYKNGYNTKNNLYDALNNYSQRIKWHLIRLYRTRNMIVHYLETSYQIADLGEHLHSYVDSVLREIVIKLIMGNYCSIQNVIIDSQLATFAEREMLKGNGKIDKDLIQFILSDNTFYWFCDNINGRNKCN